MKYLQMNKMLALNNPQGVDMPLNKYTYPNINNYDYNQTFTNESNSSIK